MLRSILIGGLIFAAPAVALAQSPTDKVKLEITRAELQVIGQGVMELPYKVAAPVMQTLQQQLVVIDQAAAKAAADAKASADKAAAEAKAKTEEKPAE